MRKLVLLLLKLYGDIIREGAFIAEFTLSVSLGTYLLFI